VCITKNYPVTVNDPALTEAMLPTLQRVAGEASVSWCPRSPARKTSRSSSAWCRAVLLCRRHAAGRGPGAGRTQPLAALLVDEAGLLLGVRTLAHLACDYHSHYVTVLRDGGSNIWVIDSWGADLGSCVRRINARAAFSLAIPMQLELAAGTAVLPGSNLTLGWFEQDGTPLPSVIPL
jgi:hypothetical protein